MANDTIKVVGKDGLFDLTGIKNVEKLLKTIQELKKAVESYDDVLNKNEKELKAQAKATNDLIQQGKTNNQLLAQQEKQVQELSDKYKENTKAKEDNKKKQEALTEAEKQALKVSKEKAKIQEQLKFAASEEAKEVAKLKIQLLQANKANRDAAKTSLEEVDAYKKKSKELNDLRNRYKRMRAEQGKATKETEDLRREVEKLDRELKEIDADVGQFQRNVGNYEKAMEGLGEAFGNVSNEINTFNFSQESATGGVQSLLSAVGKTHPAVAVLAATVAGAGAAFADTERGASKLDQALGFLKGGFNTVKDAVGGLVGDVVDGNNVFDALDKNFGNFTEKLEKNTKEGAENAKVQRDLLIAQNDLEPAIQRLRNEYELLRQASGDATTALNAQREASVNAAKQQVELSNLSIEAIEKRIAANEKEIEIAGKNLREDSELNEKRKELNLELLEAQGELNQNLAELATEQRQVDSDVFEQRLDFLIDFTDNVKAQNERILANDKLNNEQRQQLLRETFALQAKTIADQNKLITDFAGRDIDFEQLENITDSDELFKQVNALTQSEVINKRILDSLRERRTAQQDLIDAEIALKEEQLATAELTELAAEQERFNKEIASAELSAEKREQIEEEHQKNILDIRIKSLIDQLNAVEKGSLEEAELKLELAETQEEALRMQNKQIENAKTINGLADEHRRLERAVGSALIDQGTQLVKNQLAASILNSALNAILDNVLAGQGAFGGTGTAAGAQSVGVLARETGGGSARR